MAAAAGFGSTTYRNGAHKGSVKADNKSLAANQSFKSSSASSSSSSSFKSRSLQFRKSSPAALGGANGAAKDSGGGRFWRVFSKFFFFFGDCQCLVWCVMMRLAWAFVFPVLLDMLLSAIACLPWSLIGLIGCAGREYAQMGF